MQATWGKPLKTCAMAGVLLLGAMGLLCAAAPVRGVAQAWEAAGATPDDLTTLSIEDLLNNPVTSVSRKPQKLSDAAAAIFVITQEDVRRSGATTIPELLRMVPGIEVVRLSSSTWAITARGFNSQFANKLLVLFDGRSVYTPLFSGVYWDQQNYILEDIDRIEVIRGPGAALWGENAVNGVINIITKRASDTQGGLATGGGGSQEEGVAGVRYGGKLGNDVYYRAYGKYYHHGGFDAASGDAAGDSDWEQRLGGFRLDSEISAENAITVQGDFLDGYYGEVYRTPSIASPSLALPANGSGEAAPTAYTLWDDVGTDKRYTGGNLLFRWTRTFSSSANTILQAYYDKSRYDDDVFQENLDIVDLDFQNQLKLGNSNALMWGAGFRLRQDRLEDSPLVQMADHHHKDQLVSAFIQDDIALIEDKLHFIFGSKLEHNEHTGVEVQPNARLLWTPHSENTLWAAVSRAVRTPSWSEESLRAPVRAISSSYASLPILVSLVGEDDFDSEELIALEWGWRRQWSKSLSTDVAAFYNFYDNLRSLEAGAPELVTEPTPYLYVPVYGKNKLKGETYGVELSADWRACRWWRIQPAFTYLQMNLRAAADSTDETSVSNAEGSSPNYQFSLRSWVDLPHNVQFDLWLRFVDDLPALDVSSYTTLDARLGWKPTKSLEFSLVGQNLLDGEHVEGTADLLGSPPTVVERSVYLQVVHRF